MAAFNFPIPKDTFYWHSIFKLIKSKKLKSFPSQNISELNNDNTFKGLILLSTKCYWHIIQDQLGKIYLPLKKIHKMGIVGGN